MDVRTTNWWAISALSVGVFAMVTVEQLPIGILTLLTANFAVTEGIAGLTVTVPGYLAAVASLAAPIVARKIDRRTILTVALVTMTVASVASALAPNFVLLMVSRVLVGLSIGTFWSIAPTMAVRLARPQDVARATTVVFAGVSLGTVLGLPLATVMGTQLSWQAAFITLAVVGAGTACLLLLKTPRTPPRSASASLPEMFRVALNPLVAAGLAVTLLLVGAALCAFTYASPLLQTFAQVPEKSVGGFLLIVGATGLLGNFLISGVVQRSPFVAIVLMSVTICAVFVVGVPLAVSPLAAVVVMALWGLATGTLSAGCQGWINQTSGRTHDLATGLTAAAFNVAIASGAGAGGLIVDFVGLQYVPLIAGGVAALGVVPVVAYRWFARR